MTSDLKQDAAIADLTDSFHISPKDLISISEFSHSLAAGDLSSSLKANDPLANSLKSLQASLRHLVWQANQIAAGDLTQRIDFMGEFSAAFNAMTEYLRKTHSELEQRVKERTSELTSAKEELEAINAKLHEEIEERKAIEKDLVGAKEAAEAANVARSQFLSNMSHELRTPMNAVTSMTSLLLSTNLSLEQREFVETISLGADEMLAVINNILNFSNMEKEEVQVEHHPFCLRQCIEEAIDIVAIRAEEKGLKLSYFIEDNVPGIIVSDNNHVRRVLINLLGNAIKFSDRGKISISATAQKGVLEHCEVHLSVEDTGIGIPEDRIGQLFLPFQKLDMTSTRKHGGVGLGLATSKRLVEMMGGRIWVESGLGKGSTFHFTIKAKTTSESAVKTMDVPLLNNDLGGEKVFQILVAEDNLINQTVLLRMLKKLGYRADLVANGLEVLEALEHRHYDVVLMDVQMPEMDGIEASREIRQKWRAAGPKIIAITAHALEGDRERCLKAGMNCYIAKPVRLEELKAALLRCQ